MKTKYRNESMDNVIKIYTQGSHTFLKVIFHLFNTLTIRSKKVQYYHLSSISKFAFKNHNFTKNINCFAFSKTVITFKRKNLNKNPFGIYLWRCWQQLLSNSNIWLSPLTFPTTDFERIGLHQNIKYTWFLFQYKKIATKLLSCIFLKTFPCFQEKHTLFSWKDCEIKCSRFFLHRRLKLHNPYDIHHLVHKRFVCFSWMFATRFRTWR